MSRLTTSTLVLCLLIGCSGSVNPENALSKANESNLQRIANLYITYQMEKNWVGPPDETKFKEFIRSIRPEKLTRIGIDPATVDQLFVSERDGQPFKIRYSVVGSMMGSMEPVVFEAQGLDGKRLVGFLDMSQREVDEAEYEALFSKGAAGAPVRQ